MGCGCTAVDGLWSMSYAAGNRLVIVHPSSFILHRLLNPEPSRMSWFPVKLRGHWSDVFEPANRNPHGFVIVYLHDLHLTRLADQPAFTAEFERHGLPVVAPFTKRSWWTDRICPE